MKIRLRAALVALALAPLLPALSAPTDTPEDPRRSGAEFMSPQTRAMQQDDALNPAMLWVSDGEALWQRKDGTSQRACADCHADPATSMRGVAARYPRFDAGLKRPLDLHQRINVCRVRHQQAPGFAYESQESLSLRAFIGMQSRGLAITPDPDPRSQPFRARGEALFRQRLGQLELACTNCHDTLAGRHLGSSPIPQAHPTGYPLYRLEWQGLGSLQRRLRGCMSGVRAEPFAYGAQEWVDLELYLMQRAAGMAVETPAVRP